MQRLKCRALRFAAFFLIATRVVSAAILRHPSALLRGRAAVSNASHANLVAPRWQSPIQDPYSATPVQHTVSAAVEAKSESAKLQTYTEFFGWKMCYPGYAAPECTARLQVANPWYVGDCPNLHSPTGNTLDIGVEAVSLGGRLHCMHYAGQQVSPCAYLCYSHTNYGTAVIPTAIWKNAQAGEGGWATGAAALGASDDRSAEHFEGFDSYRSFPKLKDAVSVIEVGAGPWTQTKGLLYQRPDLKVKKFTIFEPMADWYAEHVITCSYSTGKLARFRPSAKYSSEPKRSFHSFPLEIRGRGGELLLAHEGRYDVLVVMNVIEHVQNAFSFLIGLHRVLKPGGTLIFHERFFASPPSADNLLGTGSLHPIRLMKNVFDAFLYQFHPLWWNDKQTTNMKARNLGEQGYYFIGLKK